MSQDESYIYGSEFVDAVIENPTGKRTTRLATGRLAKQAAGSVTIYLGDTMGLRATPSGKHAFPRDTGRLPRQAAVSVKIFLGDTRVLAAATAGKKPREGFDFFPLTVDVEERMYAAGKIPGSFFRREGRPSEDAILTC